MKKVIIYTVHKAGSMFIHRLTKQIAKELKIDYISITDKKYRDVIPIRSWNVFIEDDSLTGCFGPIRGGEAVPSIPGNLDKYSIVIHMRVPRDVLTSLYYSMTFSHARKISGFEFAEEKREAWEDEGIDSFVIRITAEYKYRYEYLCSSLIGKEGIKFLKYEDMIINYEGWLNDFLMKFSHFIPEKKVFWIP